MRKTFIAAGALLIASWAFADLPRLPKDAPMPQAEGSPGVVTFRHSTHVDPTRPDCTVCHPGTFKILKASSARSAAIRHAVMEKGKSCGRCHDGKNATGLDSCETCHKSQ